MPSPQVKSHDEFPAPAGTIEKAACPCSCYCGGRIGWCCCPICCSNDGSTTAIKSWTSCFVRLLLSAWARGTAIWSSMAPPFLLPPCSVCSPLWVKQISLSVLTCDGMCVAVEADVLLPRTFAVEKARKAIQVCSYDVWCEDTRGAFLREP